MGIGGSTELNIPGGGTEGYHVLKVGFSSLYLSEIFEIKKK